MSVTHPEATSNTLDTSITQQLKHEKNKLTELDLFKYCIVHPRYTKSIMEKYADTKEKMRVYRKVWSALTKYIRNQCFEKARCTDIP